MLTKNSWNNMRLWRGWFRSLRSYKKRRGNLKLREFLIEWVHLVDTLHEMDLLSMPSNCGWLGLVEWPFFLLCSKIFLAIYLAFNCKDAQANLWNQISKDEYVAFAVKDCYYNVEKILHSVVDGEGRLWYRFGKILQDFFFLSCNAVSFCHGNFFDSRKFMLWRCTMIVVFRRACMIYIDIHVLNVIFYVNIDFFIVSFYVNSDVFNVRFM